MRQLKISTSITNRDSQATEKYLQEIGKIEMITPEEETRLAQKRKTHSPQSKEYQDAVDKLVGANLRFVVSVAKQYQHQWLTLSDLINEWNLWCIKAAQRYDETKWFKFISYAVWRIRQSILQALAEQGRMVRLPSNKISTSSKIDKAIQSFEQEHERLPSDDELADILDMNATEISDLIAVNTRHSSLDAPIWWIESDSITMLDTIQSTQNEIFIWWDNNIELSESINIAMNIMFPPEDIDAIVDSDKQKKAIERLRNKEIIYAHFGLSDYTIEQIEAKYNLSKERVRQIKEKTIKRMKGNKDFIWMLKWEEAKIRKKSTISNINTPVVNHTKGKNAVPKIYEKIKNHTIHQTTTDKTNISRESSNSKDVQRTWKILNYILNNTNRQEKITTSLEKYPKFIPVVEEVFNTFLHDKYVGYILYDRILHAKQALQTTIWIDGIKAAIDIVIL